MEQPVKKQAILMLCHKNPQLINKIISYFPKEYFDFFVYVDKKSNIYNDIAASDNVFMVKDRVSVRWGRYTQIKSSLLTLETVDAKKYGYIHLISGQDIPIKTPEQFIEFFQNNNKEYMENYSLSLSGESSWNWHGIDRYMVYYPNWLIHRPTNKFFKALRVAWREFVLRTKIFRRKKYPCKNFYGGSSWFSITGEAAEWIKIYNAEHPEYFKFFKNTVCGDEVFYQTLMRMSPYSQNIENNCLRYMNWANSKTGGPMSLGPADFEKMMNSNCVFARKIDDVETFDEYMAFAEKNSNRNINE